MMQKTVKHIRRIAEGVLFIGFCVQICIGLIWMVLYFCGSLIIGEGPFSMAEDVVAHLLCPFQVVFAGLVSYHLLGTLGIHNKKWRICGVLAMVTFPMAMQCHLAFGTDSVVGSLLLLLFSSALRWIHGEKNKKYLQMGTLILTVALLIGIGVAGMTRSDSGMGGIGHESFQASMASRFAWSSLQKLYGIWPEEIKDVVPEQVVRETSYYADNVKRVLVPYLQQTCGTDEAGRAETAAVLRTITRIAMRNNTRGICEEIIWDAAGYGFSPIVCQLQFAGMGYDSYSGVLYDNMRRKIPYLSHIYMTYGCRWFGVALLLALVLRLIKRESVYKKSPGTVIFSLLFAGGLIVFYTFRGAGMMDYRKTIVLVLLWIGWMISSAWRGEKC